MHNETTTGVTSDIGGCRKAMDNANHPALLLVDGVSSIGALDFRQVGTHLADHASALVAVLITPTPNHHDYWGQAMPSLHLILQV